MLENLFSQEAIEYLNQILGDGAARVVPSTLAVALPHYLHDIYQVLPGHLLGDPVTFACVKGDQPLAVQQVAQHMQLLRELLQTPVIAVLSTVTPGERKQLIQKGVLFVVPNRQLFAPQMGMILTERFASQPSPPKVLASPATQALLIWFLNHHPLTEIWSPFQEAAELGYAGMTATRAVRELLQFGLYELEVRGRAKYLRLALSRRELWEKAKTYLRSPVTRTLWTYDRRILDASGARWAGETALSRFTMLNDPPQSAIAISSEVAELVKDSGIFFEPRAVADGIAVQVWRYRPDMNVKTKDVDPLSLWLSLRANQDSRIQIALDDLEEQFQW